MGPGVEQLPKFLTEYFRPIFDSRWQTIAESLVTTGTPSRCSRRWMIGNGSMVYFSFREVHAYNEVAPPAPAGILIRKSHFGYLRSSVVRLNGEGYKCG